MTPPFAFLASVPVSKTPLEMLYSDDEPAEQGLATGTAQEQESRGGSFRHVERTLQEPGRVGPCEASAWATDPESVYQCIVDAGVRIFECDGAHLHLLAVDGNSFVRHASHTDALAMADRASMLSVGVGRTKWMIRTRNPVFMDYMNPHAEDVVPKSAVDLGYKSAVSIPILAGNNLLGMYSLVYKRTLPWTEDDQDYLLDIGRVLGVLIQRIQMSKKDAELTAALRTQALAFGDPRRFCPGSSAPSPSTPTPR